MHLAPFTPPRWLASTHVQTACAALPLWAPPASFRPSQSEQLRIPLRPVGALRACAWWQESTAARPGAPTAVLVHGVGGSSESRYVVRAAVAMHRAGWNVVRLSLRGAGDSIPDAPALYHAGLTEDLEVAIRFLAWLPQVGPIVLFGFSLGGHVVLRLAGELGDARASPVRAAAAVSAPLDLVRSARALERARSLPYHLYVLRALIHQAEAFARAHPRLARYRLAALRKLRSIRAFDEEVIAPMHGFAGAEDYYVRMSAGPLVPRIRIPTLLVHAADDPIVPAETVRHWLGEAPSAVETAWTDRGGHVGWFGGLSEPRWVNTWAVDRAMAFLSAHVSG